MPRRKPEPIALSNGIRLTGREWLGLLLFAALLLGFAPLLSSRAERFALEPDYRIPHDLSNDYWLFECYAGSSQMLMLGVSQWSTTRGL